MSPAGASASAGSSSSSASSPVFLQYNAALSLLHMLLVNSLKNVIRDLQQGPFKLYHVKYTGKKAELQQRIIAELDKAREGNNVALFTHIHDTIRRNSGRPGVGQALESARVVGPGNTLGSASTSSAATASGSTTAGQARFGAHGTTSASTGNAMRGVPYSKVAGAWTPSYVGASAALAGTAAGGSRSAPNFRPSPFFEYKSMVGHMVMCPEAGPNERKSATLLFTLNTEQQELLRGNRHQLRLFCTSYEAYNASVQYANRPAPVVFPLACEARVNDRPLTVNLRSKGKGPSKVPPPNLNKDKALFIETKMNKIELSYTNTSYQKYALTCGLVEIRSIESLVDKVKSKPLTVDQVVQSILRMQQDDEIEAGATKMTLRCPLSAMRMKVPSRSKWCLHRQCFDADTFFQLNEQTPSWSCPVCNRTLNPDDLILDQYVETILRQVPEDHESIIVEPDASWHTDDNKFFSSGGVGAAPAAKVDSGTADSASANTGARTTKTVDAGKPATNQVIIMDLSPSPPSSPRQVPTTIDKGTGHNEPSIPPSSSATPAFGPGPRSSAAAVPTAAPSTSTRTEPIVIDLTLSSDEDDAPPPPRPASSRVARPSALNWPTPASAGTLTAGSSAETSGSSAAGTTRHPPAVRRRDDRSDSDARSEADEDEDHEWRNGPRRVRLRRLRQLLLDDEDEEDFQDDAEEEEEDARPLRNGPSSGAAHRGSAAPSGTNAQSSSTGGSTGTARHDEDDDVPLAHSIARDNAANDASAGANKDGGNAVAASSTTGRSAPYEGRVLSGAYNPPTARTSDPARRDGGPTQPRGWSGARAAGGPATHRDPSGNPSSRSYRPPDPTRPPPSARPNGNAGFSSYSSYGSGRADFPRPRGDRDAEARPRYDLDRDWDRSAYGARGRRTQTTSWGPPPSRSGAGPSSTSSTAASSSNGGGNSTSGPDRSQPATYAAYLNGTTLGPGPPPSRGGAPAGARPATPASPATHAPVTAAAAAAGAAAAPGQTAPGPGASNASSTTSSFPGPRPTSALNGVTPSANVAASSTAARPYVPPQAHSMGNALASKQTPLLPTSSTTPAHASAPPAPGPPPVPPRAAGLGVSAAAAAPTPSIPTRPLAATIPVANAASRGGGGAAGAVGGGGGGGAGTGA